MFFDLLPFLLIIGFPHLSARHRERLTKGSVYSGEEVGEASFRASCGQLTLTEGVPNAGRFSEAVLFSQ